MLQETPCVRLIDDGGDEINNNPEHSKGDKAPDFTKSGQFAQNGINLAKMSQTSKDLDLQKLFTGVNISKKVKSHSGQAKGGT